MTDFDMRQESIRIAQAMNLAQNDFLAVSKKVVPETEDEFLALGEAYYDLLHKLEERCIRKYMPKHAAMPVQPWSQPKPILSDSKADNPIKAVLPVNQSTQANKPATAIKREMVI